MNKQQRNIEIKSIANDLINNNQGEDIVNVPSLIQDINLVFSSEKKSFREVIFTIILARIIDRNFKSTIDLYSCNPRSIYEQGIKPILEINDIPCTQSGPLNITKATKSINYDWAEMKSPRELGMATFRIAQVVDSLGLKDLKNVAEYMGFLLKKDAEFVESLVVKKDPVSDAFNIVNISNKLISEAIDSGNTAQRVVGILLNINKKMFKQEVNIFGAEDSASTTNLTSKKIGDISIYSNNSLYFSIYEITLKQFSDQRISECSKSIISTLGIKGSLGVEVTVLCRISDVPENFIINKNSLLIGQYVDKYGIVYNFVNIFEWISSKILDLNNEYRAEYFNNIQDYVNMKNTSIKVKSKWKELVTHYS
jgi:hypothetical protein